MVWRGGSAGAGGRRGWTRTTLLLLMACMCLQAPPVVGSEPMTIAEPTGSTQGPLVLANLIEDSYQRVKTDWAEKGIGDSAGVEIVLDGGAFAAASAGLRSVPSCAGRGGRILEWASEEGWVEYAVTVPQTGLYQIGLDYLALPGRGSSIQRSLSIDGQFQYNELKRLEFPRVWREASFTVKDSLGDEYNPRSIEVEQWQSVMLAHPDGLAAEPLRIRLAAGTHRLRLEAIREPMALASLRVTSPLRLPTYAEVAREFEVKGYADAEGAAIKVQAENTYRRSTPTIRRAQDREPYTEPRAGGNIVLNTLGGETWRQGGSWASWRVVVPRTGLYRLDLRFQQIYLPDFASGRALYIDGRIPFAEAAFIAFPYNANGWQIMSLGGKKPYKFLLTKGAHTITLAVCNSQVGPVIDRVRGVAVDMAFLIQKVLQITGPVTNDPYREWELTKQIPEMKPSIQRMMRELDGCVGTLRGLVRKGQYPQSAASLAQVRDQLSDIAKDPDSLPRRISQYRDNQAQLGGWVLNQMQQGLSLDYLALAPPDAPRPKGAATALHRIWQSVVDLFISFTRDYTRIGTFTSHGATLREKRLKVWVAAYPRDYAQILKELSDEEFTPRTGIRLDVNVVPSSSIYSALILALNSGRAPDVCVGLYNSFPVEFAIRNAGVDLTKFPGFDEVRKRFRPGALTPLTWHGGVWALPEEQDFWMLFYRKDILARLNLEVPETWADVFAMIPRLQVKGMDFYYPPPNAGSEGREYMPFLFQNGGDFYTDDGLRSALNSPQALKAFKIWTQLYTDYNVPKQADFYNRFRTGEMPIGISDYYMYSELAVAAPELTGWWQMVPIPGTPVLDGAGRPVKDDDGRPVIDRSMGGWSFTCQMFRSTRDKQAAWEFMKWWTSRDVQIRFGTQLEGVIGVEARWNSANVEALEGLPWAKRDIDAIKVQWQWFRERPVVVGGYITQRYIYNAWNKVVLSDPTKDPYKTEAINPREALEDAHRYINRELIRKQKEFPEVLAEAGGGK